MPGPVVLAHTVSHDLINAVNSGTKIQAALELHGQHVNAREAAALAKLSAPELQQLASLHDKVQKLAGWDSNAAWACGLLC